MSYTPPRLVQTLIVLGNSFIWVPAGWSSADGFYCTMVTYLTVGLGDYVWPMQTSESLYGKSLQVAYFITSGIGLVAMVLSSSQIVVDEFRSMRRHYFPHLRLSMEDPFMPKTRSSSRAQNEGSRSLRNGERHGLEHERPCGRLWNAARQLVSTEIQCL